jgi:hypothetical protein
MYDTDIDIVKLNRLRNFGWRSSPIRTVIPWRWGTKPPGQEAGDNVTSMGSRSAATVGDHVFNEKAERPNEQGA